MQMLHLAYNDFKAFLEGPLTWKNYRQKVMDSYGDAMWNFHLFCAIAIGKQLEDIERMIPTISPSQYIEACMHAGFEPTISNRESAPYVDLFPVMLLLPHDFMR